ncbi:MAG: TIM barrel protein [Planctomycetota bacterium]
MNSTEHTDADRGGFYTVEELKARLCISTLVFRSYRPIGRSTLEELAACGIRKIELIESPHQFDMTDADSMRLIGEDCRSCGIEIAAYHADRTNFLDLETEADRRKRVDRCRRQIDTMLELGGNVWGSHAAVADEEMMKSHRELARHVEGTGAHIAVENFGGELSVEARMAFLTEIDHPQVGMILDIGHESTPTGENPMCLPGGPTRVVNHCQERLCHIHMHGFKDGCDHFPPLVEGDCIQWIELFRALRAVGYCGHMNFEPRSGHQNALQATAGFPERIVEMEAQAR